MLRNRCSRSKGFTLIEVLIVVVILAILAAMLIPRLVGQVDRAAAAEAFQMIGAIRKASEQTRALAGDYGWYEMQASPPPYESDSYGNWTDIGLKSFTTKNYDFYYQSDGSNYYVSASQGSNYVSDNYYSESDHWSCGGTIFKKKAGVNGDANPCTI